MSAFPAKPVVPLWAVIEMHSGDTVTAWSSAAITASVKAAEEPNVHRCRIPAEYPKFVEAGAGTLESERTASNDGPVFASPRPRKLVCPSVEGQPRLAAALELVLRSEEGIEDAQANPLTGRVLVHYRPDLDSESIDTLISGRYMETLGAVDAVVLDKTGTLTLGKPGVVDIRPFAGSSSEVLRLAASAERYSEHPAAQAICRKAADLRIETAEPENFAAAPGKGITCRVEGTTVLVGSRAYLREAGVPVPEPEKTSRSVSEIFVGASGACLGRIQVADVLRSGAREAIDSLRRMGIRSFLLTGDAAPIAAAVGKDLGVDHVEGDLLPEDKLKRVRELRTVGHTVAMVGDGVNDAPALVAANVGIAVGSGTDVARESASVLLLGDDLTRLSQVLKIARQCHGIIMTNFFGTIGVDGVGVDS